MSSRNTALASALVLVVAAIGLLFYWMGPTRSESGREVQAYAKPESVSQAAEPESADDVDRLKRGSTAKTADEERAEVFVPVAEVETAPPDEGEFEENAMFGKVVDEDGDPVAGTTVKIFNTEGKLEELEGPLGEATSGENGRFRVRDLQAYESYRVYLIADGFFPRVDTRHPGYDDEYKLERAVGITGRVVDANTTKPIAGAEISVRGNYLTEKGFVERILAVSDEEGNYALSHVATEGMQRFLVQREGYLDVERQFQVAAERTGGYDIELEQGASLVLEIYDHDKGGALADMEVKLSRSTTMRTDSAGRLEVFTGDTSRFKDGAVTVAVGAEGWCNTTGKVTLDPNKSPQVVSVPMTRGAAVKGVVKNADGNPIEHASVYFSGRYRGSSNIANAPGFYFGDGQRSDTTDEKGHFELTGLRPRDKPASIRAYHKLYTRSNTDPVSISFAGEVQEIEIELQKGSILKGAVTIDGEPTSTRVRWNSKTGSGQMRSNDRGGFLFRGVTAGEVNLQADLDENSWGDEETKPDVVWIEDGAVVEHDLELVSNRVPITGSVRDDLGNPIPEITVYGWAETEDGDGYSNSTTTDRDGNFALQVQAIPGLLFQVGAYEGPRNASVDKVAPGTTGVELVLPKLGGLGLRVVDANTGEPIKGFALYWRDAGTDGYKRLWQGGRDFSPGPDGIFRAELPIGSVDLLVLARAQGYPATELVEQRIPEGDATNVVDVKLHKGATLTITFRGIEGGDPTQFQAAEKYLRRGRTYLALEQDVANQSKLGEYFWQEVRRNQSIRMTEQGTAKLTGMPPGRYRFERSPKNVQFEPKTIEIPPTDEMRIEVEWKIAEKTN